MKRAWISGFAFGLLLAGAMAHPHFNKTVTAKLPGGAAATITYNTVPANEMHAKNAAVGSFVTPRRPRLKLSTEVKVGEVILSAGEYIIGAIKNSDDDWMMALHPGDIPRGAQPDISKIIKLPSRFSAAHGKAEHMLLDISPGSGKFEGKAVLTLHFGTLYLEGVIS